MRKLVSRTTTKNQRVSKRRHRKQQHLLDVKVRSRKAFEQRTRWITNAICTLILIGAAGAGLYFGGRAAINKWVVENVDFHLDEVRVTTDGSLSRREIIEVSGITEGMSIFAMNLNAARENLTKMSQVESVEIQRIFPNKAVIRVNERHPVAWLAPVGTEDASASPEALLIDRGGTAMRMLNPPTKYVHLPVITGVDLRQIDLGRATESAEVKAALELLRLNEENLAFQIAEIDLSKGYCLMARGRNRAVIAFGLDRISEQLERLGLLLDEIARSHREVRTVNLMVERNVPVTFMDGEDSLIVPALQGTSPGMNPEATMDDMPDAAIEMHANETLRAQPVAPSPAPAPAAPAATAAASARPVKAASPTVKVKPFLSTPKATPTPAAGKKGLRKSFTEELRTKNGQR
jgi:cell division septal protein FtsQ